MGQSVLSQVFLFEICVTLLRLLNVAGGESISDVYDKDEIINILYSDHNSVRRMYMKK